MVGITLRDYLEKANLQSTLVAASGRRKGSYRYGLVVVASLWSIPLCQTVRVVHKRLLAPMAQSKSKHKQEVAVIKINCIQSQ